MKTQGTIRGWSIILDTFPGFERDQRVEVDITPVEDTTETVKTQKDEAGAREPAQKRKPVTTLSDILSELGITREELDARVEADPFIRQVDEHRKKMDKRRGSKLNLTTQ